MEFQAPDGEHGLGAVDEADAFFGVKIDGVDTGALQGFGAGENFAIEFRLAFADQDQRHVGERRQIAARAHAALRRNHGRDAAIEKIAEALGYQGTDAGVAFGKHVGADQHHGAHNLARERLADAHAVRADDIALELVELVARDAHIGEQPHAGIDRINGIVAGGEAIDERSGTIHLLARGGGERDFGEALVNGRPAGPFYDLIDGQAGAVKSQSHFQRCF